MSAAAAIRLVDVSKQYGAQLALEPTDLEIGEGEFFCLLGPSGCGKTTTLNLVGGFIAPSAGEISIRGRRVDREHGLPVLRALPAHDRSRQRRLRAQDGAGSEERVRGAGGGGASARR